MVNDKDTVDKIIKAIDEYFADPKNVEKFKKYLENELTKPYMTNLQCNCCWCIYNEPRDPDMGTITYCSKYKDTEENKYICEQREWYI